MQAYCFYCYLAWYGVSLVVSCVVTLPIGLPYHLDFSLEKTAVLRKLQGLPEFSVNRKDCRVHSISRFLTIHVGLASDAANRMILRHPSSFDVT